MRHMRRTLASVVCAGLIMSPVTSAAQSIWFDLIVPGSLEEMLGTADRSLEGPHLLRSLIGAFHDPTGTIANPAQAAGAFRDCLGDVQRLRDRWRAVERAAGEVSLSAAASADGGRRTLEAFLDLFDLQLAGGGADQRAAPNRAEARSREVEGTADAGLPAVCGAGGGWESAQIERRLNAGETIAWDLPHFEVSLPLSPRVWLQVLYGDNPGAGAAEQAAEQAADLVGRLVTNPRAAQFYAGLAALDDCDADVAAGASAGAVAAGGRTSDGVRPVRRGPARPRSARCRRPAAPPSGKPSSASRSPSRNDSWNGCSHPNRPRTRTTSWRGCRKTSRRFVTGRGRAGVARLAPRPVPARARHRDAAPARPPVRRAPRCTETSDLVFTTEAGPQVRRPSEREHLQPAGRRGGRSHVACSPSRIPPSPCPVRQVELPGGARGTACGPLYCTRGHENEIDAIVYALIRSRRARLYELVRSRLELSLPSSDGASTVDRPSAVYTGARERCTGSASG